MGHGGSRSYSTQPRWPTAVWHCSTCNRRGLWWLAPTTMGHDSGKLVLLNFEMVIYFYEMEK
jgi:hypothetical protein